MEKIIKINRKAIMIDMNEFIIVENYSKIINYFHKIKKIEYDEYIK